MSQFSGWLPGLEPARAALAPVVVACGDLFIERELSMPLEVADEAPGEPAE